MVDINNIRTFTVSRPDGWSLFGTAKEFDELPDVHKEQIVFLNKDATRYIYDFAEAAHLITGGLWDPFAKGNFKTVEEFTDFSRTEESSQRLKKWLFNRGIAFGSWVFVLANYDHPVVTTWKMVIKYADRLFTIDDVIVFDSSINWCLVFFHEDRLFFGKDNIYDPTEDLQRMDALNERKKKFPQFRHPYL